MEVIRSNEFDEWLRRLRDRQATARVQARILRLSLGNPGDVKPVGEGISEMRIDYGPGYRLYFLHQGLMLVVLLCGGDKSAQAKDIENAKQIARRWKERT
jgi:putative addiction module killer protein